MVPHFVSRQIVVGAGKVGAETKYGLESDPAFQLSQRAEFFEEIVGLETTLKRPIINTRDEPHADAERFRRLHVIIGDANMSQVATMVKLGATALLLSVLEDRGPDVFPSPPRHPVQAVRAFALDTTLTRTVPCEDGRQRSAWTSRTSSGTWPTTTPISTAARRSPPRTRSESSWCSGARCSMACATTPTPWPTAWTGWRSCEYSTATRALRARRG